MAGAADRDDAGAGDGQEPVQQQPGEVEGLDGDVLSSYVPPPPSLVAAYADEPALAVLDVQLRDTLRAAFTSSLLGVLPRR